MHKGELTNVNPPRITTEPIKTEFLLDDISEFEDGRVVYRKDAGIINKRIQFVFSQYKEKYDSILDKVT